jgi:tyrosyl-tRNA synthetase
MHTFQINVQDKLVGKVLKYLSSFPKNEIEILEKQITQEDWSYLEKEIDKGLDSGMSAKSHEDIMSEIKRKYA